jgi:hypothetical protein
VNRGCVPMGTNARGVAQCSEGHGDYPDACNEAGTGAYSAPESGRTRAAVLRVLNEELPGFDGDYPVYYDDLADKIVTALEALEGAEKGQAASEQRLVPLDALREFISYANSLRSSLDSEFSCGPADDRASQQEFDGLLRALVATGT